MPATALIRAAIYARYSTDKQKETSVEDQFRLCRRHCDQKGWQVTQVFADHGISGTTSQRPDYLRLLQAAERGEVDIIVAAPPRRNGRQRPLPRRSLHTARQVRSFSSNGLGCCCVQAT